MSDPGSSEPEGLQLSHGITVPFDELSWRFSTAGGAGGQHVNTANTRAEVVWDVAASPSLPEWAKQRIIPQLGPVVTSAAGDRRSQLRNRELALTRLAARLSAALEVRPSRRATRPTQASKRRRLDSKRRRGDLKRQRRSEQGGSESD